MSSEIEGGMCVLLDRRNERGEDEENGKEKITNFRRRLSKENRRISSVEMEKIAKGNKTKGRRRSFVAGEKSWEWA